MKVLISLLGLYAFTAFGQVKFFGIDPSRSSLKVQGDSTLHEWVLEAKEIKAQASAKFEENTFVDLKDFELKVLVKKLKSDKASLDEKAKRALKSEDHPYIQFDYDETLSVNKSVESSTFVVRGKLSIAGTTNSVDITGDMKIEGNQVYITGRHPIKMSDYNVEPPGLLFVKAKDKLDVIFDLVLIQEERK